MEIKINKLHKAAILPFRANKSDAGYDLCSVKNKFSISRGDKIAQLIIEKCHDIQWKEASLSGTERGDKGYGSSDIIQPID
jgi:dUTPase